MMKNILNFLVYISHTHQKHSNSPNRKVSLEARKRTKNTCTAQLESANKTAKTSTKTFTC
jgi:hypothetical protein